MKGRGESRSAVQLPQGRAELISNALVSLVTQNARVLLAPMCR